MIELEKTYLAKFIPEDLKNYNFKTILDIYIPQTSEHPKLRLRQTGNRYELTKKEPIQENDASEQEEQTIILSEPEFNEFKKITGKKVHKIRYYYKYHDLIIEFDIFQDDLLGLVLIDIEFKTVEEKNNFIMPDFCLIEVTQETFIAGGKICGKKYEDIENDLNRFNYKKLYV